MDSIIFKSIKWVEHKQVAYCSFLGGWGGADCLRGKGAKFFRVELIFSTQKYDLLKLKKRLHRLILIHKC
jgi:hypothetical protein